MAEEEKRAKPFAQGRVKCLTSSIIECVCIIHLTMYKYVMVGREEGGGGGIKVDQDILAAYFV